jgi:hypothetical protein
MKNMLTVTDSGCVALGHPARPPKWLPETGNQGGCRFRTLVSNPCFELLRRQIAPKTVKRASDADTLEKEDSRSLARDARASGEQRYRNSVAPMP